MTLDEQLLDAVSAAMAEPRNDYDPEVTADLCCEQALNALDQLMVLATKDDTAHLVIANKIFIGQILTRAQLVASFLMTKQTGLRIVSNG